MMNEGLKYLKDILSNKLHNQKFNYNSNDYFIIQLSVEQAWNIVMEINEVEENAKQNN